MSAFECQDCGKQGTDKTEFKIVRYKNVGMVHCVECVDKLKERII